MNQRLLLLIIIILFIISLVFIILYTTKCICKTSLVQQQNKQYALKRFISNKKIKEYKENPRAKYALAIGNVPTLSNITKHGNIFSVKGAQRLAKVRKLPNNWDWRNTTAHILYPKLLPGNYCSDVKNQHAAPAGSNGIQYTGTCWIFSSVQTIADRFNIMNGIKKGNNITPKVDLSVQPILSCSGSDIGILTGGDSYTCYNIIINTTKGLVDTTCMPFLGDDFKDMCTPECATCLPVGESSCSIIGSKKFTKYGNKRCCQVDKYNKYTIEGFSNISARFKKEVKNSTNGWNSSDTLENYIKTEIYTHGPITIALDASPIEEFKGGSVFVKRRSDSYTPSLNHLVSIVGWEKYDDGEYWIIRNSWGTSWADQGYINVDNKSIGMDDPSNNFFGAYPTGFGSILGTKSSDENVMIQQTQ